MAKTDDPDILKIQEKILNTSQRKEKDAWAWVMSNEMGRRVLWELMMKFGLYADVFDKQGQEETKKAAQQNCAQYIRNQIAFFLGGQLWLTMEKEAMERATIDKAELERMTVELEKQRKSTPTK